MPRSVMCTCLGLSSLHHLTRVEMLLAKLYAEKCFYDLKKGILTKYQIIL